MGKGLITDEISNGAYNVTLIYSGREENESKVAALQATINTLQSSYDLMPEGTLDEIWAKRIVKMQLAALTKSKEYFENNFPGDPVKKAYCADLTTGLTGYVGTIEIPGELGVTVNIRPGYNGGSVYNAARDGQFQPSIAGGPWSTFLNKCMLPGWQKFKPLHRYGTIVADSIDFDNDTCDVCLDTEYSSQQNLPINQNQGFSECDVSPPSGFTQFCTDNPAHPTCTNTEAPGGLHISDAQYAQIQSIQQTVNSEHEYETDQSGYGVGEQWEIMGPNDKGDCEDFALTKMQDLIDAGYNAKDLQLGWGFTEKGGAHAFLMIQTTNRGVLILDNRYPNIMEISKVPYRFESYQRAGATWSNFTTKLVAVPIEYMTCNALAFADGDQVLVEFTGQDWNSPKVIGFKSNPPSCLSQFWIVGCSFFHEWTIGKYVEETEVWHTGDRDFPPGGYAFPAADHPYESRSFMSLTTDGSGYLWVQGGYKNQFHWPATPGVTDFITLNTEIQQGVAYNRQDVPAPYRNYAFNFYKDGKIYLTGGCDYRGITPVSARSTWDDVDAFDRALDTWTARTAFSKRWSHGGFVAGGYGHVFGGHADVEDWRDGIYDFKKNLDKYDNNVDSWIARKDFYVGRNRPATFQIGKGYVFSGEQEESESGAWDPGHGEYFYSQRLHEYSSAGDTWTQKTSLTGTKGNQIGLPGVGTNYFGYVIATPINPLELSSYHKWDANTDVWQSMNYDSGMTEIGSPMKLAA